MKKRSKYLDAARRMPPLRLAMPGEEFDIKKSEVARWLMNQPEILTYIVNRIKGGKGQSPYIVYDKATGTWRGVDYDS